MTGATSQDYRLHIGGVDQIAWKTSLWKKHPNLYVEIRVEQSVQRTRVIKRNTKPTWNEEVWLSARGSSILSLLVKHDTSLFRGPCIGGVQTNLSSLQLMCENDQHVSLQLKAVDNKTDETNKGFITVQLRTVTPARSAADAVTAARDDIERSGIVDSVGVPTDSEPVKVMGTAVGSNSDFQQGLGNVLSKLDIFVRIVDKTSQVHPYVNFAWQVVSSLYKAVKGQHERDRKLINLVTTMADVYTIVDAIQSLPNKLRVLEDIIAKILKQTVECAIFIRQYTGHGFGARVARQTFSDADKIMDGLTNNLMALKQSFDSGGTLQTVFLSTRTLETVEKLVQIENLKHLDPVKMDAFSRPECLPDTRQDILKFITDWLTTPSNNENILWLHAMAGFGKSTISTTVAEYFRELERLGAFMFFDRNNAASRDPAAVIRTLSYKLAYFDPSIRAAVSAQIERDFGVTEASMRIQFAKLLLEPLTSITSLSTRGPIVIVLDALDECGDPATRKDLLLLLAKEMANLPPSFRILITSRREPDIEAALSRRPNIVVKAFETVEHSGTADVSSFFRHHMAAFRLDETLQLPSEWPGEDNIQALINHSGGLFIWASTAVKFIAEGRHPQPRLDILLHSQSRREAETTLDALYATALDMAGEWKNDEVANDYRAVLGAIIVGRISLSDSTLDLILGLNGPRSSKFILSRLRCLLQWSPGQGIRTLHSSFADYLSDPHRCGDRPWFIDVPRHNETLVVACFRHLQSGLRCNICELGTSDVFNDEVFDLRDRIEKFIPAQLHYACCFWADHLQNSVFTHEILTYLQDFLGLPLLYWLEVLSLVEESSIASRALKSAVSWIRGHDDDLEAFILDANKFISAFRETRPHNARHIYLSALAISPTVEAHYRSRFPQLHLVVMRAFKLDHLLHVLEVPKSDSQESTIESSKVYPCLILYTRACINNSDFSDETKHARLSTLMRLLEGFNKWDDITVLAHHQTIKNHLLQSITNTDHHDPDGVRLEQVLKIDAVAIDALLLATLQHPNLVRPRVQEAQLLLDLLQTRVDFSLHPSLKHLHTRALIKLTSISSLYPEGMILKGVEFIGEGPQNIGGAGDIWKGMLVGQEVCVKVVTFYNPSAKINWLKEFCVEAVIWRQLHHPNVLPFYGVVHLADDREDQFCLASPWMNNGNIVDFLKSAPNTICRFLMLDIADGLNYLHMLRPSIIHGNLKGTNILITPSCRACLAHFGLAIPEDSRSSKGSIRSAISSVSSTLIGGTMRWQAPELLSLDSDDVSRKPTLASDVYAYGNVCYEIFSGEVPFYDIISDHQVSPEVRNGKRPSRPSHDISRTRGLDDDIWSIIQSCWAHEPDRRPAAYQIVELLRSLPTYTADERPVDNFRQPFPSQTPHSEADRLLSTLVADTPRLRGVPMETSSKVNCTS